MIKHMDKVGEAAAIGFVGIVYIASVIAGILLIVGLLRGCAS